METKRIGLGLVILGAVFLFSSSANAAIAGQGAWLFDEGAGSVTKDWSTNNNTGDLINTPTWITNHPSPNATGGWNYTSNHSLEFDGSSDYIDYGVDSHLGLTTFTAELWAKWDGVTVGNQQFLFRGTDGASPNYYIRMSDGYGGEVWAGIKGVSFRTAFDQEGPAVSIH